MKEYLHLTATYIAGKPEVPSRWEVVLRYAQNIDPAVVDESIEDDVIEIFSEKVLVAQQGSPLTVLDGEAPMQPHIRRLVFIAPLIHPVYLYQIDFDPVIITNHDR